MAIMSLVAHSGGIDTRVKLVGEIGSMGDGGPIVGAHCSGTVATQVTALSAPVV